MSDVALDRTDHRSDQRRGDGSVIIYILGTEDERRVKIGKTTQRAATRRRQHEKAGDPGRHEDLRFLAGIIGMDSDETAIHNYWKKRGYQYVNPNNGSSSREWFDVTRGDELLDWVRWLRQQWFVARSEDDVDGLERVPSEGWLPKPHFSLSRPMQLELGSWASLMDPPITGDDFYTHAPIIEAAREAMGGIDLDPASCPDANDVVRAAKFHTFNTNGLAHHWSGRVWCNPPFGKWELWGPKIVQEWHSGDVEQMCVLMSSRASTAKCNAALVAESDAVFIPNQRYPFWGMKAGSPDEGHPIFYFGPNRERFAEAFMPLGTVAYTFKSGAEESSPVPNLADTA